MKSATLQAASVLLCPYLCPCDPPSVHALPDITAPAKSRAHACPMHQPFCPVLLAQDRDTGVACSPRCPRELQLPTPSPQPHANTFHPAAQPGQCCIYEMLREQGYLNKQCKHNICYPTLPIVCMESFNQQSLQPKAKLI